MKKKLLFVFLVVMCVMLLAISASAKAPLPERPDLGIDFGTATTIDGFTPPSQLYVSTDERVLLTDGNGNYVTYPTYYVTKDNATFDFDFSKLNTATGITYSKASVVLLEVPDGITTISQSYFAGTGNFPLCVSVQFPGSVTSYGSSLFAGFNSVIRCVEFLDGTTPITMGDSMFGGQWNGGANSIEYVKFPNNLTSIGNNTFGKAKGASKTIIFGENLESIGTGFFGESTPSNTDTFLYVSDKFFTETAMFTNLFGSEAPYHGNNLMLTMFYTGTKAEAEALVAKGLAVQTGYIWDENKVKIVSASEYVYETHKPTSSKSITIVYDYNACDAFYNSIHEEKDAENGSACYLAECDNCGAKAVDISSDKTHSFNEAYSYTSYFANGTITKTCLNKNCVHSEGKTPDVDTDTLKPLFSGLQYSIKDDGTFGIYVEYMVDQDAIAKYEELANKTLEYGVIAIVKNKITGNGPLDANGDVATESNVILVDTTDEKLSAVRLIIVGDWEGNSSIAISMLGYVTDGAELHYMGIESVTTDDVTTKTATTGTSASSFEAVVYENLPIETE